MHICNLIVARTENFLSLHIRMEHDINDLVAKIATERFLHSLMLVLLVEYAKIFLLGISQLLLNYSTSNIVTSLLILATLYSLFFLGSLYWVWCFIR